MRRDGADGRVRPEGLRPAVVMVVLWAAAAGALALQVVAIDAQSLTGDGAYHLLAGHQALRYGQNTVNLEHPPLVKLVAASSTCGAETACASLSLWRGGRERRVT